MLWTKRVSLAASRAWCLCNFGLKSRTKLPATRIFVALCAILFFSGVAEGESKPVRRVLILNETGTSYPAIHTIDQGIQAGLKDAPYEVEVYREYMETVLFPDQETQQEFRTFVIHRYRNRKPDLIIAVGPSPLQFILETRQREFAGIPVIFCLPYGPLPNTLTLTPGISGVTNMVDPAATVEVALQIKRNTKQVIVVGGTSSLDRITQAMVKEELSRYSGRLNVLYLTNLTMPALLERLGHVPNDAIILFIGLTQDAAGTRFMNSESAPAITDAANGPVFVLTDSFLGHGEVGGKLFTRFEQGKAAGTMARRVLNGEKPEDIPVQNGGTQYVFDWPAIRRWGLEESHLPSGSIVLSKQLTIWESYKWYIFGGISMILLETILIFGLVWQKARRQKAEDQFAVTHERLRLAIEAGKFVGWDWNLGAGTNQWFGDLEEMFGILADTHSAELYEFRRRIYAADIEAVLKAIDNARRSKQPYVTEFRIPRQDGTLRWVAARGKFYYSGNGQAVRMIGLAVDVTERHRVEDLLRQSESRFRLVANTAPVMIWMSGPDRMCTYVNDSWLEFAGGTLESELGNGWAMHIHSEDVEACLKKYIESFDRREAFRMEYRRKRKDGVYRWIVDIGVPQFAADHSFIGFIGSCIDISDQKQALESLSTVSRRLIQTQEQERVRIARELHDNIIQRMAMLSIDIDSIRQRHARRSTGLRECLDQHQRNLLDVSSEIQALSHRLHSSKLEYLGLVAACKDFCSEIVQRYKIELNFHTKNVPASLPEVVSLNLFRVLQESVQNALKHGRAERLDVELSSDDEQLQLLIRDYGVGFDFQTGIHSHGLGLISMRERVSSVNGTIAVYSKPGYGTEIKALVPIAASTNAAEMITMNTHSTEDQPGI